MTEAFYVAEPYEHDEVSFDLAEKNGWLTCSTARSSKNPDAVLNFWKCDLCGYEGSPRATRSDANDKYKSHLLRQHDDQGSLPPGTLTPAETCFPVSTAKHRAKKAVKSEGKEVAARRPRRPRRSRSCRRSPTRSTRWWLLVSQLRLVRWQCCQPRSRSAPHPASHPGTHRPTSQQRKSRSPSFSGSGVRPPDRAAWSCGT